jgi:general stress protein CsbA
MPGRDAFEQYCDNLDREIAARTAATAGYHFKTRPSLLSRMTFGRIVGIALLTALLAVVLVGRKPKPNEFVNILEALVIFGWLTAGVLLITNPSKAKKEETLT